MKRLVYHRNIDKLSAFSIMVDNDLKPQYAAFLAQNPVPFEAALMLIPDNHGMAAWVAVNWANDPEVLAERDRVRKEIGESLLPGKTELCEHVWGMVTKGMFEDRLKAAKLYAELRGYIEKAAPAVVNNTFSPKVIQVTNHGTNDQWEDAAEKQQRELLSVASTRH